MRHPTGKLPDRLHFLRLAKLVGENLAVGYIQGDADHSDDFALAVAQRLRVRIEDALRPFQFVGDGFSSESPLVSQKGGEFGVSGAEKIRQ